RRKPLKKLNNKGLSLVELVVVILMMGLISTMLVVFVSTSRMSYQQVSTEVQLQDEATFAMSYIEEIAVEAKECTAVEAVNDGTGDMLAFCIKAPDSEHQIVSAKDYYYIVALEPDTGIMRFVTVAEDDPWFAQDATGKTISIGDTLKKLKDDGKGIYGNQRKLLAKNVKPDGLSVSADPNSSLITVDIVFALLDKEYNAHKVILGRNFKAAK
nr:hypothetical protein [Butyrivibrio sp.]